MTIEDYNEWIEQLKTVEVAKCNLDLFNSVFRFSPEKFAKANGLEESFVKEFQKERKIIHNRLIDYNVIQSLKKRKVVPEKFFYGGNMLETRVCVCIKRFKNEENRAKGRYDFHESIFYNYIIIFDRFSKSEEAILFDAKGGRTYSTINEFNKHFVDIREHKIDMLLKSL